MKVVPHVVRALACVALSGAMLGSAPSARATTSTKPCKTSTVADPAHACDELHITWTGNLQGGWESAGREFSSSLNWTLSFSGTLDDLVSGKVVPKFDSFGGSETWSYDIGGGCQTSVHLNPQLNTQGTLDAFPPGSVFTGQLQGNSYHDTPDRKDYLVFAVFQFKDLAVPDNPDVKYGCDAFYATAPQDDQEARKIANPYALFSLDGTPDPSTPATTTVSWNDSGSHGTFAGGLTFGTQTCEVSAPSSGQSGDGQSAIGQRGTHDDRGRVELVAARTVDQGTQPPALLTVKKQCSLHVFALRWGRGATPAVWDQDSTEGGKDSQLADQSPKLDTDCEPESGSEWIACSTPSKTQLNWPVTVVRGSRLDIASVQFRRGNPDDTTTIRDGTLIGDARLPSIGHGAGGKLQFKSTGVNLGANQQILTINELSSTGALPNQIRLLDKLTIAWHISQAAAPKNIQLGTSTHPLFVTLAPAPVARNTVPRISLLYAGTKAAAGTGNRNTAESDIWTKVFANHRSLHRVTFDPVTGSMTQGPQLSFWPPDWSPQKLFIDFGQGIAQTDSELLRTHVGTCDAMAGYMIEMLELQGISARKVAPEAFRGWEQMIFPDAQFFLVGNWKQQPQPLNVDGYTADDRYPSVIEFQFSAQNNGTVTVPAQQYSFVAAKSQNNDTPKAMWDVRVKNVPAGPITVGPIPFLSPADHRVVETLNAPKAQIYDPSYAIGPKPDIRAWAKTAIAAWAKLSDGHGHDVDVTKCGTRAGQLQTCYLQIHVGSGL